MEIRNELGKLNFSQNLFKEAERAIKLILRSITKNQAHT